MQIIFDTVQDILSFIAPHRCLLCNQVSEPRKLCRTCSPRRVSWRGRCWRCWEVVSRESGHPLCKTCRHLPLPWRRQRFLSWYNDAAREVLHHLKFRSHYELAEVIGGELSRYLPRLFTYYDWDIIVPLPSSPQNAQHRGFHICEVFVSEVSKVVPQATPRPGLLSFHARTTNQGSRAIRERLSNPLRRMTLTSSSGISGSCALLIDDVETTGSTLYAAYRALVRGGVREVDVLTFCRSERWHEYRSHLLRHDIRKGLSWG